MIDTHKFKKGILTISKSKEGNEKMKTLYFEGAGWEGAEISKNTIGNCRIRTAFHTIDGEEVK